MEFFGKLKETVRDKARDNLCGHLMAIGVDASLAEPGQAEEGIMGDRPGSSLGLIEVRSSLIKWVNVLKQGRRDSYKGIDVYSNVYLVPDSAIRGGIQLKSVRVKTVPVFGKVVGVRWRGKLGENLVRQLEQDRLLNQSLIWLKEDIKVRSYPGYKCWAIWSRQYEKVGFSKDGQPISKAQWNNYEAIARHLSMK